LTDDDDDDDDDDDYIDYIDIHIVPIGIRIFIYAYCIY